MDYTVDAYVIEQPDDQAYPSQCEEHAQICDFHAGHGDYLHLGVADKLAEYQSAWVGRARVDESKPLKFPVLFMLHLEGWQSLGDTSRAGIGKILVILGFVQSENLVDG